MYTKVKSDQEIESMRVGGKMLATVLGYLKKNVKAGITTKDSANMAKKELKALGGEPAFLNYQGFPDVLCVSVNDEIVHGIPGNRELVEGDIVSFDFGVNYKGMITDSAFTMILSEKPTDDITRLLNGTEKSMYAAIDTVKSGVRTGDIASAAEKQLIANKLGIVRELVGHGVGHSLHEEPNIPNYGIAGTGHVLKTGMTIAIEPMAMLGREAIKMYDDGWTVVTADSSLSAHFEHTVLIKENGFEILTII